MTPTEKGRDAAIFAQDLAFHLLGASTPGATHAMARSNITKAFTTWEALKRRMDDLADLAPNCASEGRAAADVLREIAQRSATEPQGEDGQGPRRGAPDAELGPGSTSIPFPQTPGEVG